MKKKKILVKAYFAKNLGDDLFLKILFERYPQVEWYLLTANKDYEEIFKKYKNVYIIKTMSLKFGKRKLDLFSKVNDTFLRYKKYDALVNIGGSIFIETPNWERGLVEREYLPNIFKENKKSTFIIGANFGPFSDDLYIEKHKEFFLKFDDVCFRENYSYATFKELSNVRVAPDVVFNLDIKKYQIREKSVGFSIIDLENRKELKQYYQSYVEKNILLIEEYIENGYKINLFSFCEKEGDLKIINSIINSVNPKYKDKMEIIKYEEDIEWFLDRFKSCEVIIGTRFHSIILALLLGQGVFPIIYSDKTYNVLKDLNMEKHCCYIKDIGKLNISEVVAKSFQNKFKNNEVLLNAERQFEKLDEFIS